MWLSLLIIIIISHVSGLSSKVCLRFVIIYFFSSFFLSFFLSLSPSLLFLHMYGNVLQSVMIINKSCIVFFFPVNMLGFINRIIEWFKSLFWKEEMELTLVGLQNSGKTTFVNVIAVRPHCIVGFVVGGA